MAKARTTMRSRTMDTIVEEWRLQEKEGLMAFYDALEAIVRSDGRIGIDAISGLTQMLGTSLRNVVQGDRSFILNLVDYKIDVANDDLRRAAGLAQLEYWRGQLAKPAKWNRHREVDDHIIHMHLKRLKGGQFPELLAERYNGAGLIPYAMDIVESDLLSLHIIASGCAGFGIDQGNDQPAANEDIVRRAIRELGESDFRWASLPNSLRRGIHITADFSANGASIKGNHVEIATSGLPSTFVSRDHIGRPIHDIVDIKGFRNDDLKVRSVIRKANEDRIVFVIDRHAAPMRRRLELS